MIDYTQQYYILRAEKGNHVPFLGAAKKTAERNFSFEQQPAGSAPLVFSNTEREKNRREGVKEEVTPILFHGSNLAVCTLIRNALMDLDIPHLHMHPSIYIDDEDRRHEHYWYLTFTELFDCWDRAGSETSTSYLETGGEKRYDVYAYELDKAVLDNMPLEKRLLFKMGGTIEAFVFCHESILGLFGNNATSGARMVLAADY